MIWHYDGSLEGFWTLVARSYLDRMLPVQIVAASLEPDLFDQACRIERDEALAARAAQGFARKAGEGNYNRVVDALRLERPPLLELLLFVRLGFKEPQALHDRRLEVNRAVGSAAAFAYREAHRQIGFVRFMQWCDETLYASIAPKAAILDLMAPHFQDRMAQEPRWIIHDRGRNEALVGHYRCAKQVAVETLESPRFSEDEAQIQALWRCFFDRVTIEARRSPKRQRQLVPRRFEPHMTEMR